MTEQATGALSKLVMGFEDVAAGTVATAGFVMPIVSSTLRRTRNKIQSRVIRGNFNPGRPSGGNYSVAGQVVVPLDSVAAWYWFKAMFNSVATTGAADPYTHVFKMTGTTKRSYMSIEHQFLDLDTPQYFQFTGCKISSASFSVGDEGEMLLTMDIVGFDRTISATAFDATPTDLTSYSTIEHAHAVLEEGGVTFADATNVSFQINFNPDTSKYLIGGGGKLGAIPEGIIGVSGSNDFLFKDTTLLEKAINSTESSIEVTFTGGTSDIVAVLLPELEYGEADPGIDGPQGLAVSLPYEAYYNNSTEESAVVVTLTNAEAHA